jgi:alpha-beta hydrolase superfamily lysophospholipase
MEGSGMKRLLRWLRTTLTIAFALLGFAALVLLALIAVPVARPPVLASVASVGNPADFGDLAPVSRFTARDGTELAYRRYAPQVDGIDRLAIVVHGSSGRSRSMHVLAKALGAQGVEAWAIDVRGHGGSGTRGDIAYLGQLEHDLADLVSEIRKSRPNAAITLIGFSSGGGFALRAAASPIQHLFARTVLLAPYLGNDAESSRPNSGGWAKPDLPRIVGLLALRAAGLTCCESLPVIAFAVPPNSEAVQTGVYSFRLLVNFGIMRNARRSFETAARPLTIYAGRDDELMVADKYADVVRGLPGVDVKVLDGFNHMRLAGDPAAAKVIATDVATR